MNYFYSIRRNLTLSLMVILVDQLLFLILGFPACQCITTKLHFYHCKFIFMQALLMTTRIEDEVTATKDARPPKCIACNFNCKYISFSTDWLLTLHTPLAVCVCVAHAPLRRSCILFSLKRLTELAGWADSSSPLWHRRTYSFYSKTLEQNDAHTY